MNSWPVQNAKSRFSEFLDACITVGPQLVTKHGAEAAVLVSVAQWRRLQGAVQPSLKEVLMEPGVRGALPVPPRGRARRRDPVVF
jgi:prevent-host-death family protein